MQKRINNSERSQAPGHASDSAEERDFSNDFDARAQDDDGILLCNKPKNIGESIKLFLLETRDKISNWFQPVRNFLRSKFHGAQSSRALMNVKQDSATTSRNLNKKPVAGPHISDDFSSSPAEKYDVIDSKVEQIKSEDIKNNKKDFEEFEKFKKIYGKYKKGELNSVDNFKTENAKRYAEELIKKSEKNVKNDPNYFFKNVSEYKDVVVAAVILDKKNEFALNAGGKDEEKNFSLWVTSKDPEAFAKLRTSETGLSVNLQKAKIYADWVVFQNLIGELPESVDQSIIPLAIELRDMMEGAKAETAIDALRHDATRIADDMMAFFVKPKSGTVVPVSPSTTDQRPVTSVKSASVPELTPKSLVSSDPPPPPPPRRPKATSDAGTTNADVLTDIAQSTPPPAPSPRVRKSAEEIQQKQKDKVITLRSVAEQEVEANNLSLSKCVDIFKNLSYSHQTKLGKLLAPDMALSDFRSLVNQSSLFFTDLINRRPINADREAQVYKLSGL